MTIALIVVGAAAILFHLSTLSIMSLAYGRLRPSRYRTLLRAIMVDAGHHIVLGSLVIVLGVVDPGWVLLEVIGLAAGFTSMLSGINALLVMREVGEPIRKAERMMVLLSSRVPDRDLRELGLTDRELDVLGVVVRGRYRDQEIAEELFISKATAATHIRNILKKAELSDRRDLLLLGGIGGLRERGTNRDTPEDG